MDNPTTYGAKYADADFEEFILAHVGERVVVAHDPIETPDETTTEGRLYPGYIDAIDAQTPGAMHSLVVLRRGRAIVLPAGNVHSVTLARFITTRKAN